MSSTPKPNGAVVQIAAYDPNDRDRTVQIVRHDGALISEPCASQGQLEALVQQHRPGTDLTDPVQVYWEDRPGQWSAA
jgi:hypothetical protein